MRRVVCCGGLWARLHCACGLQHQQTASEHVRARLAYGIQACLRPPAPCLHVRNNAECRSSIHASSQPASQIAQRTLRRAGADAGTSSHPAIRLMSGLAARSTAGELGGGGGGCWLRALHVCSSSGVESVVAGSLVWEGGQGVATMGEATREVLPAPNAHAAGTASEE